MALEVTEWTHREYWTQQPTDCKTSRLYRLRYFTNGYNIHILYESSMCFDSANKWERAVVTLARESPGGTAWWEKEREMLHCLIAAGRINPKQHLGKHCGGKSHWLKMLKGNALWVSFAINCSWQKRMMDSTATAFKETRWSPWLVIDQLFLLLLLFPNIWLIDFMYYLYCNESLSIHEKIVLSIFAI